ncbi:hypothetical protein DPSP01_003907 [Paraphaeosphaeria sporulosa]|uniref:GST N-terminal domain-containing protein n=1 Tax=Paraphaeosphaeria sporulosa TaxID=1460663 RepID=A0A177C5F5_9PLEO|nr:uncharacterized protein CC84DRAFT_1097327 [Paraphaeosphaeria sporulosa]OAG02984.1 hypothetical protein CC84DRAFT_1097327 [Paraphaeosphaeria sporulosa]
MGSTVVPNDIVLFNYPSSPFGRRIQWYLQLRAIEYALVEQPVMMPRTDLEKLGVKYRRIPILAIGRDVYLDTRLILRTLEKKFPDGKLGSDKPEQQFIEKLLDKYMVEGPVFQQTAGLVPSAFLKDPSFAKDRKGFLGRNWTPDELDEGRPESLVFVRNLFDLLETTILADGRNWVLGTERPSLADIQAIWPVDWATSMNMPSHVVSEELFPKVYAWISRFQHALKDAAASCSEPVPLNGDEAVSYMKTFKESQQATAEDVVDKHDPQEVERGTLVEMYPSDWGSEHRDAGRLVALARDEVTIMAEGALGLRIHAPRTGFKMTAVEKNAAKGGTKL